MPKNRSINVLVALVAALLGWLATPSQAQGGAVPFQPTLGIINQIIYGK